MPPGKSHRQVLYRLLEGNPSQVITMGVAFPGSGLFTPFTGTLNRGGMILTGFEEYAVDADLTKLNWDAAGGLGGSITVVGSTPRSGAKCLLIDHANHTLGYLQRNIAEVDDQTIYTRELVRFSSFATVATVRHWLMSYSNTSPLFQRGLVIDATTPKLRFDATDLAGTGTLGATTLVVDTWYLLEFMYYRKSGVEYARQYRLSTESGTLIEESALFTTSETGPFNTFHLGSSVTQGGASPYTTYRVDDFALKRVVGKQLNLWIGTGRVGAWGITGTVSGAWTPTGGSPNGINVDEVPGTPNDADYNESATPTQVDRFSGAAVTSVPAGKLIRLMTVNGRFSAPGSFGGATTRTRIWDDVGTLFESATFGPSVGGFNPLPLLGCLALEFEGLPVASLASLNIGYEKIGADAVRIGALWGAFDWRD